MALASKLEIPGGTFNDPDLYLDTSDLKQFGTTVIAKAMRRSRPFVEAFYVAWNTNHIKTRVRPDEHDEQAVFISMARTAHCDVHSVPNGGVRGQTKNEAIQEVGKLKREGMSPGAPDVIVVSGPPVPPADSVPIVAIEFKKSNGSLGDFSPLQLKWLETYHTKTGGRADACGAFGYDAGLAMLEFRGYAVPPRSTDKYTKRTI